MKAGLLSIAALSAVAIAQPHNHRRHQHVKKQDVDYVVETETSYATATAPGAVVYVDGNGNPISTSIQGQAAATSAAQAPPAAYSAPAPVSSSQAPPPPPAYTAPASSTQAPAPPAYTAPASSSAAAPAPYSPPASSSSSSAPAQTSSSSSGSGSSDSGSSGYGITYSPYNSDNSCKTQDQVNKDFESINGYGWVRIYGTDCNQASTVISAASAKGMKTFAGIYDINQVEDSVNLIKEAVNGDWSKIHTIAVGNEGVNAGTYTVPQVKAAVDNARSCLSAVGYTGKIVTVDTFVAIIANPDLCEVGDYVAANCHAFFDGGVTADKAGDFVVQQAQRVSAACNGKDTMITESGWPSSGSSNKLAVPSTENQKAAVDSLKSSFSSNLILFTAFNDYWKQNNAGTFGAEQYWGIYGNCPSE